MRGARRSDDSLCETPGLIGQAMAHQFGACGYDCDQHQPPKCLGRNFIPQTLSGVHAQQNRQHRGRRDYNIDPTELGARHQKYRQQAGGNDEIKRCFLCESLSAQPFCQQKYENKRPRHGCDAARMPPKNPNTMPAGKTDRG